jgi:hypothetical protein
MHGNTMYRLTLHLRYSNKDNRWHLYADARHWKSFDRKADGESIGRERGSLEYRQGGEARLTVHRSVGSVELHYTYARNAGHSCKTPAPAW